MNHFVSAGRNISPFIILPLSLFLCLPATTTVLAASNVAKTGQTIMHMTGDDGNLEKGISWPSPRFTDNGDGTVTDNLTNLVWTLDASCHTTLTWNSALSTANSLADGDCLLTDSSSAGDWRVPNLRELESLLHYGFWDPAIPNTQGNGKNSEDNPFSLQSAEYWSSTTVAGSTTSAYAADFQLGVISADQLKTSSHHVLFVRDNSSGSAVAPLYKTGQTTSYAADDDGELKKGLSLPTPRFADNGNGTVYDNVSNLVWMKNANCWGLNNWSGAISSANNLKSGSCGISDGSKAGEWRLPNRRELQSLMHYGYNSPALSNRAGSGQAVDGNPFTNMEPTSGYWTSTTYNPDSNHAWFVNINQGLVDYESKTNIAYVWAVRDAVETLAVNFTGDGDGRVTSSPSGIDCPGTCSADFAKFSTVTLTAEAADRSRLDSWSIGSCGSDTDCEVDLSSSTTVTVTFSKIKSTVSAWMILLTE